MKEFESILNIKVEYSQTDKMGYVHHSQYLVYYEYARHELLRKYSKSYKQIEAEGVMMPVVSAKLEYIKPAYYDDELTIITHYEQNAAKYRFKHQTFNQYNELINTAEIQVVCIDSNTRKAIKPKVTITNKINRSIAIQGQ